MEERVPLLALRLGNLVVLVALLTMHLRSLRVFRWEQSVSGGLLVTYCIAILGLALCAGAEQCGGAALQNTHSSRSISSLCLFRLSIHLRSQTLLFPIAISVIGQAYLCGAGAALLAVNAAVIWQRWRRAGELTQVVAELLGALGVPLKRQITLKVTLSAAAAVALLTDLALAPLILPHPIN